MKDQKSLFLFTALALAAMQSIPTACAETAGALQSDAQTNQPIPWSEVGAKATAQYSGDGLSVFTDPRGAVRLRCAFQRLEGEVTDQGLWLTSTVEGQAAERFRVVADYVGRNGGAMVALAERGVAAFDAELARFTRRGLREEYSVSVDGVRQDFIVDHPPSGLGALRVELALNGAQAKPLARGARLVLGRSGRELAYSRLQVTDANGKELPAQLDVVSDTRLAVVVDDAGAAYPVRIDPTFSDTNWAKPNHETKHPIASHRPASLALGPQGATAPLTSAAKPLADEPGSKPAPSALIQFSKRFLPIA